jgi:3'-phosphoadenosine 5'-phosphosulfate sulfotransferase (PAPS reductase)/FAD synthetase
MSHLAEKERRAIKILRMYKGDGPIEVSYSGGKDSDVILALEYALKYALENLV